MSKITGNATVRCQLSQSFVWLAYTVIWFHLRRNQRHDARSVQNPTEWAGWMPDWVRRTTTAGITELSFSSAEFDLPLQWIAAPGDDITMDRK